MKLIRGPINERCPSRGEHVRLCFEQMFPDPKVATLRPEEWEAVERCAEASYQECEGHTVERDQP